MLSATGCASWQPTPKIEYVKQKIADDLLTPDPLPVIPLHGAAQADWQDYTARLLADDLNCRKMLSEIKAKQAN